MSIRPRPLAKNHRDLLPQRMAPFLYHNVFVFFRLKSQHSKLSFQILRTLYYARRKILAMRTLVSSSAGWWT